MRRSFSGAVATSPSSIDGGGGGHDVESEPEVFSTVIRFTLPRGYIDEQGNIHKDGSMRLATARDELVPLVDERVRNNPAYLTVVLLGRVVERIGDVHDVSATTIENLFAADIAFLQDLYRRVNTEGHTQVAVACPHCSHEFSVDMAGDRLGES